MASAVQTLIDQLSLKPHPEGGWYRETWRAETVDGTRAAGTAVLYLLPAGHRSHWNRSDASEVWLWHEGDALVLELSPSDDGPVAGYRLGMDLAAGDLPQLVVPPGHWQSAALVSGSHGYCLISCVVAPAFEFAEYELAPPGWSPGA